MDENQKPKQKFISFHANPKDVSNLAFLIEMWGENRSQSIKRAIQIAVELEKRTKGMKHGSTIA